MRRRKGLFLFLATWLPWLAFSVLAYFDLTMYGALAGLAALLALLAATPRGRRWGALQAFSLLFFLVASAASFAYADSLRDMVPNLLASGFACLVCMAGYGVWVGVFFPAHYLTLDHPDSMRESPILRRAFWLLTLVWDVIFLLGLGVNVFCMLALSGDDALAVSTIASTALFGAGLAATPLLVLLVPRRMEAVLVEKGPLAIRWGPPVLSPGRSLRKNEYDAVVVGAGLGGLACASLLANADLKVLVAEKGRLVGGYCQTYDWEGYPLNTGPTLLLGSEESGVLSSLIRRLGLEKEIPLRRMEWGVADGRMALRLGQGAESDARKLEGKFPDSRDELRGLMNDLRRFRGELLDRPDFLSSPLPFDLEEFREQFVRHPVSSHWQNVTFQAMLEEYLSDESLVRLLGRTASVLGGDPRDFPAYEGARLLVALFLDGIYYPVNHFSHLSGKLAGLVRKAGGDVLTSCGVEEVLVQGEGAGALPIGLRLADGSQARSNVVVLDMDPRQAMGGIIPPSLLGGEFVREVERLTPSPSAFLLHLIYAGDLRLPDRVFLLPSKPRRVRTGKTYLEVDSIILTKERATARGKKGCVLLARVNVPDRCYAAFEDAAGGAELGAELTALIKEEMGSVLPATRKHVREFVTLPTHLARLTSNGHGSAFGFAPLLSQWYFRRPGPRLPLPNLYLVGAWSRFGGGLEGAALSGAIAARELCGEHPYAEIIPLGEGSPEEAGGGGKGRHARGREGKEKKEKRRRKGGREEKREERERREEKDEEGGIGED